MRLDQYLTTNNLIESRNKAQYEIKNGNILVNNKIITKASYDVLENDVVEILNNTLEYVSKGGLKLERALEYYNVNPTGFVCLDIGASTGGFTDCLLKHGAIEVYSIDTGIDQLHESLRNDKRVHSLEKTNFLTYDLNNLKKIDLCVIDVSFVKVETIYDRLFKCFHDLTVISLIKPQFEIGKTFIKNGVVKDNKKHEEVVNNIKKYLITHGAKIEDVIESPILGGSGNKEFLIKFKIM